MIYRHVAGITWERCRIYVWEILAFPAVSDVHLRKVVCRYLLVLLNIDAIPGGVTFRQKWKKLEQVKGNKGLSGAYTTVIRPKTQK